MWLIFFVGSDEIRLKTKIRARFKVFRGQDSEECVKFCFHWMLCSSDLLMMSTAACELINANFYAFCVESFCCVRIFFYSFLLVKCSSWFSPHCAFIIQSALFWTFKQTVFVFGCFETRYIQQIRASSIKTAFSRNSATDQRHRTHISMAKICCVFSSSSSHACDERMMMISWKGRLKSRWRRLMTIKKSLKFISFESAGFFLALV